MTRLVTGAPLIAYAEGGVLHAGAADRANRADEERS